MQEGGQRWYLVGRAKSKVVVVKNRQGTDKEVVGGSTARRKRKFPRRAAQG